MEKEVVIVMKITHSFFDEIFKISAVSTLPASVSLTPSPAHVSSSPPPPPLRPMKKIITRSGSVSKMYTKPNLLTPPSLSGVI